MDPDPQNRSIADQLLIDLSAFVFTAQRRVQFSEIRSAFSTVPATALIDALADLEEQHVISISPLHDAVSEEATRVTHDFKSLK